MRVYTVKFNPFALRTAKLYEVLAVLSAKGLKKLNISKNTKRFRHICFKESSYNISVFFIRRTGGVILNL